MPHHDVKPQHRTHARRMRKALTDAELKLWNCLRAHRLEGLGFRRQLPILGYIVDFACPEHKLIIEIDCSQHADDGTLHYSRRRALKSCSKTAGAVIRFWYDDVLRRIVDACLHILRSAPKEQS